MPQSPADYLSTIPTCPRCGSPARLVVLNKARARCVLNSDMSIGRVVSASKGPNTLVSFECGGGHQFTVPGADVQEPG